MLADHRGESLASDRIAAIEFVVSCDIGGSRGRRVLITVERLIGPQALVLALEHQLADGAAFETRHLRHRVFADADSRSQHLVGGFQAGCDVDGVAVGGVVEVKLATEVTDDGGAGIDADTGLPQRQPATQHLGFEAPCESIYVECAGHGPGGMVRAIQWRAEHGVYGVADNLLDCALMAKDDFGDVVQVFVEQCDHQRRFERFDQGCEVRQIGEQESKFAPLAAEFEEFWISGQFLDQIGRKISRERRPRLLRARLLAAHLANHGGVIERPLQGVFQIGHVDGLGDEVEGAPVHGRANICCVAVGSDDDSP